MYQNCCKKCGSISLHIEVKGNNTGLYCNDCGAYIKWLNKDELRAFEYSMREATKKEQESVNQYTESISKPTGLNFNDDKTILERLQTFVKVLDKEIDAEYDKLALSAEDAVRKNAYCYGLGKVQAALVNIIEGRDYDDLGE